MANHIKMAGRNSIQIEAVNRRRKFIFKMKVAGYSVDSICEIINGLSGDEGWGTIHRRMVFYDLFFYFREHPIAMDDGYNYAYIRYRDLLDTLEKGIDEISLEIQKRTAAKDWKPFEFPRWLMRKQRMQMKYANIMGWNYSKRKKPKWDATPDRHPW